MNNNQTNQQSKSDPKGKAIASVILGVISIVFITIIYIFPTGVSIGRRIYGIFLIALIGLVCGIEGLRSTRKGLAIFGIMICIISLIIFLKISGVFEYL